MCGIIESKKKRTGLEWYQKFLGLDYDSSDLTVGLVEKKRYKMINGLMIIIIVTTMEFKRFDSLLGTITWAATLAYPFTAYIRRLRIKHTNYINKYGRANNTLHFIEEEIKDCRMLVDWLRNCKRVSMFEICGLIKYDRLLIWTDGATNGSRPNWNPGIGAYCNGDFIMCKVPELYKERYLRWVETTEKDGYIVEKETDIAHFEALAVVVALNTFRDKIKPNTLIDIRCDNKIFCGDLVRKRTNDVLRMDIVRWIIYNFNPMMIENIRIECNYILSKGNDLADPLSRFSMSDFKRNVLAANLPIGQRKQPLFPTLGLW